jgi:hypothetical protein
MICLFVFNLRIPTLLSPIAEDLDWNGRRFWADFLFTMATLEGTIYFLTNQEYDSCSLQSLRVLPLVRSLPLGCGKYSTSKSSTCAQGYGSYLKDNALGSFIGTSR